MIRSVAMLLVCRACCCSQGQARAPSMPKMGVLYGPRRSAACLCHTMSGHAAHSTPMKTSDDAGIPSVVFANRTAVEVIVANASDMTNHAARYLNVSGSRRYSRMRDQSSCHGSDSDRWVAEAGSDLVSEADMHLRAAARAQSPSAQCGSRVRIEARTDAESKPPGSGDGDGEAQRKQAALKQRDGHQ